MTKQPTKKPVAKLIGANGNIFNLTGIARTSLKNAGLNDQSDEMTKRVLSSKSYEDALCIISEYVKIR